MPASLGDVDTTRKYFGRDVSVAVTVASVVEHFLSVGYRQGVDQVKLQKRNTEAHGVRKKNALDCTARKDRQSEGVSFAYRRATSSYVGVAFVSSLLFGIYSSTKQKLQHMGGESQSGRPQLEVMVPSASFGGAIISFVLCSSELLKVIEVMQVQGTDSEVPKRSRYCGSLDCALKTMKDEGESIGTVRYCMLPQLESISADHYSFADVGIGLLSGGLGGVATNIQTSPDKHSMRNPLRIRGF
uniref:Uncharacterized protein n=1 Tax=Kalanchoe fedtschenkoi TaxID=63787 RepID=A0A7N0TK20_KALFE